METILIIDDEEKLRSLLARIAGLEGYTVVQAGSVKEGLKKLEREDVRLVITDVKLPDGNGVELTQKIKTLYPHIEVLVLTAFGSIPDGVRAIKNGAFDYITKGDDNDKIIPLISRAMEKAVLQNKIIRLEKKIEEKFSFKNILGSSRQISETVELARRVAPTSATVLILGETGTGKEVFAQAIHCESERKLKNFVAVNCSAFNKELLENELFGHKAGAFTGAMKDSKGLFDEANGGTLFLDEIGEMGIDLQSKLLRVLESKEFLRLGDTKPVKVDVRIIAATNRDLKQEIENEKFREDLFYRLSVFQIRIPALRERKKDIEPLAKHFISVFTDKTNKPAKSMTPEFMEMLIRHNWKGNVRELKNVIERAIILCDSESLTPDFLPMEIQFPDPDSGIMSFDLANVEKNHIMKVLAFTKGNKTETARLLNIALTTLYRKLQEFGINHH
jgi:two-component system NtrC family response regulator